MGIPTVPMDVMFVLWIIFSTAVLYSFGRLAIEQAVGGKLHVAAMALCLSMLVCLLLLDGQIFEKLKPYVMAAALIMGTIGLVGYHTGRRPDE